MTRTLKDYPSVSLKTEDFDGRIDFVRVFGRKNPLHVEIGTGRATFLLLQAKAHPDIDFIGIEWASRYYRYAVDRLGRWSITNVRLIRTDAAVFLTDFVADNSVECFHIYFPDPWPKKRHHKRRFFNSANLDQLVRCLKTGGAIRIATDHAGYFEQIKKLLAARPSLLEEINFTPADGAETGENVGSNFERKYLKQQKQIYAIAVKKLI